MNAYLQSLGQNDVLNQEWEVYKLSNFKYDPTYNYYEPALEFALRENKISPNRVPDEDVRSLYQARFFERKKHRESCCCDGPVIFCDNRRDLTADEIKYCIYQDYLSYQYKYFKKNWKPVVKDEGLKYMMITLNYADDLSINEVVLETARILNLPILKPSTITYTYEMFGSKGTHPHVHALVELKRTGTVAMSSFLDDVYKKKALKGKLHVDFQFSWAKEFRKRCRSRAECRAYCTGHKAPEKMKYVEKDKLWKKENNLEEFYIKDNM